VGTQRAFVPHERSRVYRNRSFILPRLGLRTAAFHHPHLSSFGRQQSTDVATSGVVRIVEIAGAE
jgi:hypothetical protein